MYSNTLNPWQIGELSDRLNRLGTVRLAAMMDFEKLRRAGNFIRDIRNNILPQIKEFQKSYDFAKTLKAKESAIKSFEQGYVRTEKAVVALTGKLKMNVAIESRIERSYDYIEQWRTGLKWLRIRHLEGFPSYGEFVERRLGPKFDYISKLRNRYTRLMSDMQQFHTYYITKRQAFAADNTERREKGNRAITISSGDYNFHFPCSLLPCEHAHPHFYS